MSGLSLGMSTYGGSMQGTLPAAASVSPGAPTISSKAFGVYSQQEGAVGPRTAGFGTVALGLAGAAILAYLWWSLPR
jgi:hypothetical protein